LCSSLSGEERGGHQKEGQRRSSFTNIPSSYYWCHYYHHHHRQGLAIEGLATYNFIKPAPGYTTDDVAYGIQDFLICVEMAFAAIAHKFFFSYKDMDRVVGE